MKKIRWAFMIIGIAIILATCSKKDEDKMPNNPDPEPTPVGTIVGEVSTMIIGPDGGLLNSADGKLELEFPAGALSSSINVSIQSITNHIPGGRGNAYRIGPEGTTIDLPVTLKLNYTEDDISGSLAILLGLAFQGSDGIWYSITDRTIDTVNRTISISTQDLFVSASNSKSSEKSSLLPDAAPRDWGTFTDLYILPSMHEMRVNESKEFKVMVVIFPESDNSDDEVPGLPQSREVSARTVSKWAANGVTNGNSQYGTIVPNGSQCNYKAPGTKPGGSKNPVQLSADLDHLVYRDPVSGRDLTNLMLVSPVKINDDNFAFQLKIEFNLLTYPAALFTWTLADIANVDLEVNNGLVTIVNKHNQDGTVSPTSQSTPYGDGTCMATWLSEEGSTGYLNVTSASGETAPYGFDPDKRSLIVTVKHGNTKLPKFRMVCNENEPVTYGGEPWGSLEVNYSFILKDSTQVAMQNDPNVKVTLTPK